MDPCESLLGPAMRPVTLRTSQTHDFTGCWDEPQYRHRRLGHAFDQLVLDHHGHVRFLSSFSRELVSSLVTLYIVYRAAINDVVQGLMRLDAPDRHGCDAVCLPRLRAAASGPSHRPPGVCGFEMPTACHAASTRAQADSG